jgi:hypothetical protein
MTTIDFNALEIKIKNAFGVHKIDNNIEVVKAAIPPIDRAFKLPTPITGLILYIFMMFGILLGQLFQEVTSKPEKEVSLKELLKALNRGKSWGAFLASPIVFFSTASSLLELGVSTIALYYALQNGFFCMTIFNGISKRIGQSLDVPVQAETSTTCLDGTLNQTKKSRVAVTEVEKAG